MKILKVFLLLIPGIALIMQSCDKISQPYSTVKSFNDDTTGINIRKVLLEDYTGHLCTNCPKASMTAKTLEEASGGHLIVMAVHAGNFANAATSGEWSQNFKTPAGEAWYSDFGIQSNPIGMLDRKPYQSTRLITPDLWAEFIDTLLLYPQEARIGILNTYNSSSRNVNITLKMKFLIDAEGSYNVTVCIVEDSIIGPQKNNDPDVGTVPDINPYTFMDVLRGSINGSTGEQFITDPDTIQTYVKNYSYTLNSEWVPKNCAVIAFISNASTKEVLQAEKAKIIK